MSRRLGVFSTGLFAELERFLNLEFEFQLHKNQLVSWDCNKEQLS